MVRRRAKERKEESGLPVDAGSVRLVRRLGLVFRNNGGGGLLLALGLFRDDLEGVEVRSLGEFSFGRRLVEREFGVFFEQGSRLGKGRMKSIKIKRLRTGTHVDIDHRDPVVLLECGGNVVVLVDD